MGAFKYFILSFNLVLRSFMLLYGVVLRKPIFYNNQYDKSCKNTFQCDILNFSISVACFYLYFIDIHERVHLFCSLCKYKESFSNILPEPYLPIIYG